MSQSNKSIEARRKYVTAFNTTMIKIWHEQIVLLGVINTEALYRSTVGIFMTADGKFNDITLEQAFNTYGLFVDYGIGHSTLRGNPGDIGKSNGRKRSRSETEKEPLVLSQVLCFCDEYSGVLRRLPRPGVLPCHIKDPQSQHYASRSHSLIFR